MVDMVDRFTGWVQLHRPHGDQTMGPVHNTWLENLEWICDSLPSKLLFQFKHISLFQIFPTSKYATFDEVVAEFLKQDEMSQLSPKAAAFAVAGAVR